jgi:hypothetical protein
MLLLDINGVDRHRARALGCDELDPKRLAIRGERRDELYSFIRVLHAPHRIVTGCSARWSR